MGDGTQGEDAEVFCCTLQLTFVCPSGFHRGFFENHLREAAKECAP